MTELEKLELKVEGLRGSVEGLESIIPTIPVRFVRERLHNALVNTRTELALAQKTLDDHRSTLV